ncbi:MAG: RluA family pseudouridine synthase [Sedimentisphaeraceae bacterium JB056]
MPDGRFANASELAKILEEFQGGEKVYLKVGPNLKLKRVDQYLNSKFSRFSRTLVQKLVKEGDVLVNDKKVKPSTTLNSDDVVAVTLPKPQVKNVEPEDIPIDVVYEDDYLLVINKQPNIVVHPARAYKSGTLVNALVHHCEKLSTGTYHYRPGIVHRLDKDTTGAMVVAKTDEVQWKLSDQFRNRTTKKTYVAIVHGNPELDSDQIKTLIGMHPTNRERSAVRFDEGKEAITVYKVLERFRGFSLVELDLYTGRTHQIRVHMSHIGHPLVADQMYGGKDVYLWQLEDRQPRPENPLLSRQALHAWKLAIDHPKTGKRMKFEAPIYDDMNNLLEMLRKYRPFEKKVVKKKTSFNPSKG